MKHKPIKYGRPTGYYYGNRLVDRGRNVVSANLFEFGNLISPKGNVWRPCGMMYPGVLLVNWETGQRHSVCLRTLIRLAMLGWIWRPDSKGEPPKFRISRWPDGSHYYLTKEDGDPVPNAKAKYDSYDDAHLAGTKWAMTQ